MGRCCLEFESHVHIKTFSEGPHVENLIQTSYLGPQISFKTLILGTYGSILKARIPLFQRGGGRSEAQIG